MTAHREARGGTLIVGGGFAGATVARKIGKRGATLLNPDNFMVYTPLLPEAAAATLEPRHVVVPLRQMCRHAELLLGSAVAHDPKARVIEADTLGGRFAIGYERLVIALGAIPRRFPVPGLREHGRGFKDVADAIGLRNRVLRQLETAAARIDDPEAERDLGFVFVGAGYAGVEALSELHDLAQAAVKRYYPSLRALKQRWVLVDAAPTILSEIPRKLGEYTHRELTKRGIEIHTSTTLSSFDDAGALLSTGEHVPARTLVWAAGVKANPALAGFGLPLDDRGRVIVEPTLQVRDHEHVWALGDCAAVPNTRTPGRFDPPTCQHALRQARQLRRNLFASPKPYGYRMLGQVATLGRYKGIAELPGLRLRGFPGWFVARTYHLYALPTMRRRVRVVSDWTLALFFRRDIVELSALTRPSELD